MLFDDPLGFLIPRLTPKRYLSEFRRLGMVSRRGNATGSTRLAVRRLLFDVAMRRARKRNCRVVAACVSCGWKFGTISSLALESEPHAIPSDD
jgi:hypothetical protein